MMDMLTEIIQTEIKRQYKSVRQFSIDMGIPQTTLASALKKGVDGTSYATIVRICEALDIKVPTQDVPVRLDEDAMEFVRKLNSLDEMGRHTVSTILEMEYKRCSPDE